MYLPRNLPLCAPHLSMWIGESGKRYDFAVARPGTIGIDEPAVFILARHDGNQTTALYVGQTDSLHREFGLSASESCPDVWRRALAMGMTHVHVRFDACSRLVREAEVRDLVAVLAPAIADAPAVSAVVELSASRESADDMPARRAYARHRSARARPVTMAPLLASTADAANDVYAEWSRPAPSFRADPAREEDDEAPPHAAASASPHSSIEQTSATRRSDPLVPITQERASEKVETAKSARSTRIQTNAIRGPDESSRTTTPTKPTGGLGLLRRLVDLVAHQRSSRSTATVIEPRSAEPPRGAAIGTPQRAIHPAQAGIAPNRVPPSAELSVARVLAEEAAAKPAGPAGSWSVPASHPVAPAAPATPEAKQRVIQPADTSVAESEPVRDAAGTSRINEAAPSFAEVDVDHRQISETEPARVVEATSTEVRENSASERDVSEPDVPAGQPLCAAEPPTAQEIARRTLDIDPQARVALFAGSMSHETGADILLHAAVTVCGGNPEAMFLFAGDGALQAELQGQAVRAGLERRCRFLGDVSAQAFDTVLSACDFVVIPARVSQGEGLARMALAKGKPVLSTHQASIGFIAHGKNGLVAYDNPGSLVWGVRELLGPLYFELRRNCT